MEPCKIRGTTQPLVSRTGAGRQGNIFSFQSREKNVLDFSSYRSGFCNKYHSCFFPESLRPLPNPTTKRDYRHSATVPFELDLAQRELSHRPDSTYVSRAGQHAISRRCRQLRPVPARGGAAQTSFLPP